MLKNLYLFLILPMTHNNLLFLVFFFSFKWGNTWVGQGHVAAHGDRKAGGKGGGGGTWRRTGSLGSRPGTCPAARAGWAHCPAPICVCTMYTHTHTQHTHIHRWRIVQNSPV